MSSVLLMNNGYPTDRNPSYCSYIKSMKEGLEAAGHAVSLLVLDSNFSSKREQIFHYAKYYRQILKNNFGRFDYVLMNHYGHFAMPIKRKLLKIRQPVIHWHGEDLYPKNKFIDRFFTGTFKFLPAHTMHIAPSVYYKEVIAEKLNISESKIAVSPSGGVDTTLFANDDRDFSSTVIKLGFASSLVAEKGVDIVLQLLRKIEELEKFLQRKIELHYIYYGKQKTTYNTLLKRYDNVVCWEAMPSNKMPRFFQEIDLLLFPTIRKQESLGLVALEAMSCGTPVIAPNAFASKEYILSGISGELFTVNDFEDFFNKIIYALSNIRIYHPRNIVLEKYSRSSVIEFYKNYFINN